MIRRSQSKLEEVTGGFICLRTSYPTVIPATRKSIITKNSFN